jgi:UDP-hydrolysing UDP-N-acetyl-D-glucosamine 2-epimerase
MPGTRRVITFVTGTRAEFGLMARTLAAIQTHPKLRLRIVATGMHLDRSRGYSLNEIPKAGFKVDATVPWPATAQQSAAATAVATGRATAGLAATLQKLRTDVVLVVGDRVEAFAAAAAGHVSGLCVAHVHGGDRAPGVIDDSLRHAITKLSHLHFPATVSSAQRLRRLGEDAWRIHRTGSPGIDGIRGDAAPPSELANLLGWKPRRRRGCLICLHPAGESESAAFQNAADLLKSARSIPFDWLAIVYPNNDPGAAGIVKCWDTEASAQRIDEHFHRTLPRPAWLGLLRDAAVLAGNSSSGIIESASFRTPVVDVGPRQAGREHGRNVTHTSYTASDIRRALRRIWNGGDPVHYPSGNLYAASHTASRIAHILGSATLDQPMLQKLIAY